MSWKRCLEGNQGRYFIEMETIDAMAIYGWDVSLAVGRRQHGI